MTVNSPYTLRPHQVRGAALIRAERLKGHKAILAVMATGGGKTLLAALGFIASDVDHGKRVLFIAHSEELIDQPSRKLDEIGIHDHGVIMANHWRARPNAPVQVASIQTLRSRIDRLSFNYDSVIIDEAHRSAAPSYRMVWDRVREQNPKAQLIGLTATPYRADGQALGDIYDALVEVATTTELMSLGYLVPIRTVVGEHLDLSGVRTVMGDFDKKEIAEVMDREVLVGHIVDEWMSRAKGRSTICFAQSIPHSRHIVDQFSAAGIAAEHLDGSREMKSERPRILERLASGETTIVSNFGVLVEGFDCPRVSCMIGARATKSRGLWRQMVGRILRPDEGKCDAIFLDHASLTAIHGFITDPDRLSLRKGVLPALHDHEVECPHCGVVLNGRPPFCPSCGKQIAKDAVVREVFIPQELRVGMVEITPEQAAINQAEAKRRAAEAREAQRDDRRADFWRKCLGLWERDKEAIAANIGFSKKWEDPFQKWPEHADFTGFPVRPEYNRDNRRWEWKARFTCKTCLNRHNQWQDEYVREYDGERNMHSLVCSNCGTCYCPRFDYPLKSRIAHQQGYLYEGVEA